MLVFRSRIFISFLLPHIFRFLFSATHVHISTEKAFENVWNKGISFGMFSNSGEIGRIIFIFIGIIFGVLIPIFTNGWNKIEKLGCYLISGGALGNSLDRIIHGKVIDFIDIHFKNIHWPAFNFADICITCGIVIVLFSGNIVPKDN